MRAAPPAPATNVEPGRHARHSPPWRQVARRPLTVAVLLGGVLTMAIAVAGLLVLAGRPGHPPRTASAAPDGPMPLGTPAALPKPATGTPVFALSAMSRRPAVKMIRGGSLPCPGQ